MKLKAEVVSELSTDFEATAGEVVILPKDDLLDLIRALKSCARSMQAHPECVSNSEFEGFVNGAYEALDKVVEL